MGSFAARYYTELYGNEISGAIYCGTSGENPATGIAVGLASFVGEAPWQPLPQRIHQPPRLWQL